VKGLPVHVFVTGASGYIGGTVASRLVREGHVVSGLTRDAAKAEELARLGIQPVVGGLDDAALLTEHAQRSSTRPTPTTGEPWKPSSPPWRVPVRR
jgi:uncharacterized protein YbjT (DUF2867 family)